MRKWFRKLWNDERGNALIIAAGAMPMVIGSAGLATDTIQWSLLKRQLQRAADSSALAGAYARYGGDNVAAAVADDLTRSNQTGLTVASTLNQPTNTTTYSDQVQVTLRTSRRLPFSSFFTGTAQTLTATATAAAVPDGEYCVVALSEVQTDVILQGSINVTLDCGAFANYASGNPYDIRGNPDFEASPIASAGPIPPSDVWGDAEIQPYRMQQKDPFLGRYDTNVPTDISCTSLASHVASFTTRVGPVYQRTTNQGVDVYRDETIYDYVLNPGCFSDFVLASNGTYTLNPGVYYLWQTNFKVNAGSKITGSGVTFILTGTSPTQIGTLEINGNSTLDLVAPTTGSFAKMLFIQSSLATRTSTINGNSSSQFDGALYFPNTEVVVSGSNAGLTECAMIVSNVVTFAGNANMTNDADACVTDAKVALKVVRLVG